MIAHRCILARAALSLALGLPTTIVVSWLLAAFLPQRGWHRTDLLDSQGRSRGNFYALSMYETSGATRRTWELMEAAVTRDIPFIHGIESPPTGRVDEYKPDKGWCGWGALDSVIADRPPGAFSGCDHAAGFPVRALWYQAEPVWRPRFGFQVHGGIMTSAPNVQASDIRALPYFPIWPGLAMNTLIYAAAWFPLLLSASALRSQLRRRRNLCPRCAYSVLNLPPNSPCPECGHHDGRPRPDH